MMERAKKMMSSNIAPMETTMANEKEQGVDVMPALSSLWTLISDSINKGSENLVTELNHLESTPTSTKASTTAKQVASFINSLKPQVEHESERLVNFTGSILTASSKSANDALSNFPHTDDITDLLSTLASVNKSIVSLSELEQRSNLQVKELKKLGDGTPSQIPTLLMQVSQSVRKAQKDLTESSRIISETYPGTLLQPLEVVNVPEQNHVGSSSGGTPVSTSSLSTNRMPTNIVPIHEHDPLLFFAPAAADVFKAARRDGSVEDAKSTISKFLMG